MASTSTQLTLMNAKTTHVNAPSSKARFIQTLAESSLFRLHQGAFNELIRLSLSLVPAKDSEHGVDELITTYAGGLAITRAPVRIGKNTIAFMQTGCTRLLPPGEAAFHEVAREMLADDKSASEIHTAKVYFDRQPTTVAEHYNAAKIVLASFAAQLAENAHRMLFAQATHEPDVVRNAKAFIHDHLAENLSLEAVANAVNVSLFHFCKLFKKATGLTFTDFVNHARVEKARRMLMRPSCRITEVAYDVGFQSLSHFNRSFRRITSESPTEFRSRLKLGNPKACLMA
jgi:AraC-like DNA-binding protein